MIISLRICLLSSPERGENFETRKTKGKEMDNVRVIYSKFGGMSIGKENKIN